MVVTIFMGTFITAQSSSAGEIARDGRFIAYDNGTVLDTKTNLMWAAKDNDNDINWADAKSYCENYRGGGYTDWRMPTQDELSGLYDEAKTNKSGRKGVIHLTKLIHLHSYLVWTDDATSFSFFSSKWFRPKLLTNTIDYSALPVRSGK